MHKDTNGDRIRVGDKVGFGDDNSGIVTRLLPKGKIEINNGSAVGPANTAWPIDGGTR